MLRPVYRGLVALYPADFRREYGDLVIDCIDQNIAEQTSGSMKLKRSLYESSKLLGSLPSQYLEQKDSHSGQLQIVTLILAATTMMIVNEFGAVISTSHYTRLSTAVTGLVGLWLCLTYDSFKNPTYRFMVVALAIIYIYSSAGSGMYYYPIRNTVSYVGQSLPWAHQHPIAYNGPIAFYLSVWLAYVLPFVAIFLIGHGLHEGIQKLYKERVQI